LHGFSLRKTEWRCKGQVQSSSMFSRRNPFQVLCDRLLPRSFCQSIDNIQGTI
jgi:hypothetical protein